MRVRRGEEMGDDDEEDHHHHYGSASKMSQMGGRSKSKTHGLGGETKGSDGHARRQEKRKGVIREAAEEEQREKTRNKPGVHRGNGWYEVENPHSCHGTKDKMYFVHYDTKRSAWKLPPEATEQAPGAERTSRAPEAPGAPGAPGVEGAERAERAERAEVATEAEGGVRDKGALVDEGDSGGTESKERKERKNGTDGKDVYWFNTDDESVEWCEPHSVTMDRPLKRRMFYAR